jgi:SAM-dependent methyltransferase
LIAALRAFGALGAVDRAVGFYQAWRAAPANADTAAAHAGVVFPPAWLIYEVQSYARLDQFLRTGAAHARAIADLIGEFAPQALDGAILEWGCGPGRVLRPLGDLLAPASTLSGCDPNPDCVSAARAFAPGATIAQSRFAPPAPYPAQHFDAIYGVSILTHLDQAAAGDWLSELARLLKPGGVVILSTHGARHAKRLSPSDQARFDAGAHVALGGAAQGSRAYSSYTPPAAMAAFAATAGLAVRARLEEGPALIIGQDIWVLTKPSAP